ncbi:MAG: hypothetical protein ACJAVI_002119 [Candidatus Azotimanducaceae bacterium]
MQQKTEEPCVSKTAANHPSNAADELLVKDGPPSRSDEDRTFRLANTKGTWVLTEDEIKIDVYGQDRRFN